MEEQKQNDEVNSLEGGGSSATTTDETPKTQPKASLSKKIRTLISHLNIYILLFILILVLALGFTFISVKRSKQQAQVPTIQGQELSPEALEDLQGVDAVVGDPKQTLAIESNAIFSGKVLVRDSLDVAGTIRVGGSVSLPGITVSGSSSFGELTASELSVDGNTTIQGQLSVQQTLAVTGGATFGGTVSAPELSVQNFKLNGDLQLNRHIDAGGGTPGKSNGGALGSGGTASVSGTDTAGTVTINTGGSSPAGCFVTINFTQPFNETPHVVITPSDADAAGIDYYVTRDTGSFSICATSNPPDGASFSFDYIAID